MPIEKKKQTRKIQELFDKIFPVLEKEYHLLEFDNFAYESIPRLRIYYQDILCIVRYGEYQTEQYSLNWYTGVDAASTQATPEVVNASSDYIASHIIEDATTFFLLLSKQPIRGR